MRLCVHAAVAVAHRQTARENRRGARSSGVISARLRWLLMEREQTLLIHSNTYYNPNRRNPECCDSV
jgi:hypothetical protein